MLFISQTSYLPQEKEHQFSKEVTDFFFKKALREQENQELQRFCIDKGLSMLYTPENIKLAASWVTEGKITIDGEELKVNLTEDQKYQIIVKVWASSQFNKEEKDALMTKAMEGDESDKGKKAKKQAEFSLADPVLKAQLWTDVTNLESEDSLELSSIKMAGFMTKKLSLDIIKPYFQKYYEVLPTIAANRDREYTTAFMNTLSPAFMAREEDKEAFKALIEKVGDERKFVQEFCKKQIEVIELKQKSIELCKNEEQQ
jgi:hypothetical protein